MLFTWFADLLLNLKTILFSFQLPTRMSVTSQWVLSIFLCLCVIALPIPGSSLRRAFPVDLSSLSDQEIYDLNREIDDQQNSLEPYETSLFPVYQKLVDDANIYDVAKSPAIEHVKSRKIAFPLEQPPASPQFDSIPQLPDTHEVLKKTSLGRYIPWRRACHSTEMFKSYEYLLDETGAKIYMDQTQRQYFWVTECDSRPGAQCVGLGPEYNTPVSSICEQKYGWVNVHGRRNGVYGDYWVVIPSCCSCAVRLP